MVNVICRGKRVGTNQWVYGYYVKQYGAHMMYLEDMIDDFDVVHVDPNTIGQYTGLTDKNGNKIFENDIINFRGNVGVVRFAGGSFFAKNDDGSVNIRPYEFTFSKIIGNVDDDNYVYCVDCKYFNTGNLDENGEPNPTCIYKDKCNFWDWEDGKHKQERPFWNDSDE